MTLQEIAKKKGKSLLIESFEISVPKENIEIYDKKLITEKVEGKDVPCRGCCRGVPVHRIGEENLNGRVYPLAIEEDILKNKLAENTLSLADHPEKDDGSVTRICGVWKNYKLNDDMTMGFADLYFVGDIGEQLLEVLNAGGKLGASRVGYGNIDEADKKTVKVDDYELVRLGDVVLTPSANVWMDVKHLDTGESKPDEKDAGKSIINDGDNKEILRNSIEKNDKPIVAESTNKKSNETQEEVEKMDKVLEHMTKNQLNEAIRRADKETDLVEAIRIVKSIEVPNEFPVLREKAETKISALEEKLDEQQKESKKTIDEKTKILENLQEENENKTKEIESLNEKLETAQKIIEKTGVTNPDEAEVLQENIQTLQTDMKKLLEDNKNQNEDLGVLVEERKHLLHDVECFLKDRKNFKEDLKYLKSLKEKQEKNIDKLTKKLFEAEEWIAEATSELEEGGYVFEKEDEDKLSRKKKSNSLPMDMNDEDEIEDDEELEDELEDDELEDEIKDDELEDELEDDELEDELEDDELENEEDDLDDELEDDEEDLFGDEDEEIEVEEVSDEEEIDMSDEEKMYSNQKKKNKLEDEEMGYEEEEDLEYEECYEDAVGKAQDGVPAPYPGKASSTQLTARNKTGKKAKMKKPESKPGKRSESRKRKKEQMKESALTGKKSKYVNPRIKKRRTKKKVQEEYSFVNRTDETKESIRRVFAEKVQQFPGLKEIRKEVLSCDSPYDASVMIEKYVNRNDQDMITARKKEKMVESYKFQN